MPLTYSISGSLREELLGCLRFDVVTRMNQVSAVGTCYWGERIMGPWIMLGSSYGLFGRHERRNRSSSGCALLVVCAPVVTRQCNEAVIHVARVDVVSRDCSKAIDSVYKSIN